jgi:hypothetical protein
LKNFKVFILLFILLSLTRVDFRISEFENGFQTDDHEYYYHVKTIVVDGDLDYSNQFLDANLETLYITPDDEVRPNHPIGMSILTLPFYFVAFQFSKIFNIQSNPSFEYFIYSFSTIFYFFLSLFLLKKILITQKIEFKIFNLYLFVFGSGLVYFAFFRFSMTPVYELFSVIFLYWIVSKTYDTNYWFLVPIFQFFFMTIRFSNYHIFLIPLFFILLEKKKINRWINFNYFLGFTLGIVLFFVHTKIMYGVYTLNPADIFVNVALEEQQRFKNFFRIELILENLLMFFRSLKIVFFGQEFGLIFFSPILFITPLIIFKLSIIKEYKLLISYIFIFLICFFPIVIYQSTSYSYGYRYLYSFIPLNLLIYFRYLKYSKFTSYYLVMFSLISFIFTIFFQTSNYTNLSEVEILNSFGQYERYSNTNIFYGSLNGLLEINSYIKLIFTSFTGILLMKSISMFLNPINFIGSFVNLSEKEIILIENLTSYSTIYFILVALFYAFIVWNFLNETKEEVLKKSKLSD